MATKKKETIFVGDGPVAVRNLDDHTRVFPTLTRLDGHVLVLGPGEEAVLAKHPGVVADLQVSPYEPISGGDCQTDLT